MSSNNCPSCNAEMQGDFCHLCGEKAFEKSALRFGNVLSDIAHSATDLDGKFLKSLRLLVFKPGQLTVNYLSGKRVGFLSPFRLFLFVNIIYFVVASAIGQTTFSTRLSTHVYAGNFIHNEVASEMVLNHLNKTGEAFEVYEKSFDDLVTVQAKIFVALMIPMMAAILWLISIKIPNAAITAWVFVTHVFSVSLLMVLVFAPIWEQVLMWLIKSGWASFTDNSHEFTFSMLLFVSVALCYFFAFQRVFQNAVWLNAIRSVVLICGFYLSLLIYRMLLFFITFYSL